MTLSKGQGKYSIAKGRAAENEIVELLKARGFPQAERRRLSGRRDIGDIAGVPGVLIDCKNRRKMDLAAAMDDLSKKVAAAVADDCPPVVSAMIFKRPRKPADQWYAVMPVKGLLNLLEILDNEGQLQ